MDKRTVQTETLLVLRKQLSALRAEIITEAAAPEFKGIRSMTEGTALGVEMALKMVDANLAMVTQDMDTLKRYFGGDDDALGDGIHEP